MTSPPPMVPSERQVWKLIEFLMKWTQPSPKSGVDAAGVVAPRGDRGIGRAAVALVDRRHVAIGVGSGRETWCWAAARW